MQKLNKKGFFLVETVVVIGIVATVLVVFYKQLANIYQTYEQNVYYDSIPSLYAANNVKDLIVQDDLYPMINSLGSNAYLDITSYAFTNNTFYGRIKTLCDIEKVYFTPYNVNTMIANAVSSHFDALFVNYLKALKRGTITTALGKYRVIVILKDHTYANVVIDTVIVRDGLVAYWSFDNGQAVDSSGNNNNGTVVGAVATTDRFGIANKALRFNGTSDRVDVPLSDTLNITGSEFSISAWIKADVYKSAAAIAHKDSHYSLAFYGDATSGTITYADSSSWCYSCFGYHGNFLPNTWYHIVMVKDFYNNVTIYANNRVVVSQNFGGPLTKVSTNLSLGSYTTSYFFDGILDDIHIYNIALSWDDVSQIYRLEKPRT